MTILDFSTTNSQITDEVINVSDSNPVKLTHDVFYNKTGKLVVIRTAAGGGGTLLTESTDYDIGGAFPDSAFPTSISPDVGYTTIAITNATYHDTDLYVSYYPITDLMTASRWNGVDGSTTVTGSATLGNSYVTNVNAASATITVPEFLPIGTRKLIRKITDSAGTVTISRSGSDTFTRADLTSVTLTSDGDFWLLEKVTATRWELVDGVERKSGTNDVIKYSNGIMVQWGSTTTETLSVLNVDTGTYGWSYYSDQEDSYTFEEAFTSVDYTSSRGDDSVSANVIGLSTTSLEVIAVRAGSSGAVTVYWSVTGRWYA